MAMTYDTRYGGTAERVVRSSYHNRQRPGQRCCPARSCQSERYHWLSISPTKPYILTHLVADIAPFSPGTGPPTIIDPLIPV